MDQILVDLLKLKGKESVRSVVGIHGQSDIKTEVITARIGPSEYRRGTEILQSPKFECG